MSYKTRSPIIFCIFNRPELTRRVFEAIRNAQPSELYIIADGPRPHKPGELEYCETTRRIVRNIDWPCTVDYDFSETNLGCRDRIHTGISSAFRKYEFAIILEDDCLPSVDFFRFTDTIRERYEADPNVRHISGSAFVRPHHPRQCYYRSLYPSIWGWATWKRVWESFDLEMRQWPELKKNIEADHPNSLVHQRFCKHLEKAYLGKVNSWGYPYCAHILHSKGDSITPLYNLVKNIGFGEAATHTSNPESAQANLPLDPLPMKIIGPSSARIDAYYSDIQLNNTLYRPRTYMRLIYRTLRMAGLHISPKLFRPKQ